MCSFLFELECTYGEHCHYLFCRCGGSWERVALHITCTYTVSTQLVSLQKCLQDTIRASALLSSGRIPDSFTSSRSVRNRHRRSKGRSLTTDCLLSTQSPSEVVVNNAVLFGSWSGETVPLPG